MFTKEKIGSYQQYAQSPYFHWFIGIVVIAPRTIIIPVNIIIIVIVIIIIIILIVMCVPLPCVCVS